MSEALLRIVKARLRRLTEINALIVRSKSHWSWPAEYLVNALPLHRLTAAYLRANCCFEVLVGNGTTIAFFALEEDGGRVLLDNLWVEPEAIGQGVGRFAWKHCLELARQRGWSELWVLPDPPSEGFYLNMGFSDTGERKSSRVPNGPVFSLLQIDLRDTAAGPGYRAAP